MVGELTKRTFRYTDLELASGAVINATDVVTSNGKVESISLANVMVGDSYFSFSIDYNNEQRVINYNAVLEGINAYNIVKEFIDFVESDINL